MTSSARKPRDVLAERLRAVLQPYGAVREVSMFGGLSFMVDDRMAVAAGRDGDLLVRTDPAEYDDLLQRGGEPAFMGQDRPMGPGWIRVPGSRITDEGRLGFWVQVGVDSRDASK